MRAKLESAYDLLCLLSLSTLSISAVFASQATALRVVLGVPFIMFFPGYALVAALFPGRDGPTITERLGLSLGLSVPVAFLVGFFFNYTPLGITVYTVSVSQISIIALACVVAYYRRIALPQDKRFAVNLRLNSDNWLGQVWLDRFHSGVLALSLVAACGTLLLFLVQSTASERFTEFYVLGSNHKADEYPEKVLSGEPITLVIGIVNQEHGNVQYHIEMRGNTRTEQVARVQLRHGERWEQSYTLTINEPGEERKITFLLYRGEDDEPYRSLHLWVTVKEEQGIS